MAFYFVTIAWRRIGQREWTYQNDITDDHPLAYLRGNKEASRCAVAAYEKYQAGEGPWAPPTEPEEYVIHFWAEITPEEYERHQQCESHEP